MVKSEKSLLLIGLIISIFINTVSCSNLDIQTLNNKAAILMEQGDIDGAIARLEAIQDLNPNFPVTNFNLGIAYQKKENADKAIHYLKRSIELKPDFYQASLALAISYERLADGLINEEVDKHQKQRKKDLKSLSDLKLSMEQRQKLLTYYKNSELYYEQYLKYAKPTEDKVSITQKIKDINDNILKFSKENSTTEKPET